MTMSRGFQIALATLGLIVAGAAAGILHLQNVQLRRRLERQRPASEQAARLRDENTRLRALVAGHARDAQSAAATVRSQLQQVRTEISALEKAAVARRAEADAKAEREAAELAAHRDPTTGLTRLEFFRVVGSFCRRG